MLHKPEATCRKLASRSRARIRQQPVASSVPVDQHNAIITAFFQATRDANLEQLIKLLSEDVVFSSDGGGKASAVRRVLQGQTEVADWIRRVLMPHYSNADIALDTRLQRFNGAPGLLIFERGTLVTAFSFVVGSTGIQRIDALRNPDKLRWLM